MVRSLLYEVLSSFHINPTVPSRLSDLGGHGGYFRLLYNLIRNPSINNNTVLSKEAVNLSTIGLALDPTEPSQRLTGQTWRL